MSIILTHSRLLTSGAYSDLTITCGSDTYKVHKNIVCERAEFFARAVNFGGEVSRLPQHVGDPRNVRADTAKEAQTGIIDLPEDEPEVVKLLVQYLYEGEYDPPLPLNGEKDTNTTRTLLPARPTHTLRGSAYNYNFPHSCVECYQYGGSTGTKAYVCPHHICGTSCNFDCQDFNCLECTIKPLPAISGGPEQLLDHAKMYEMGEKYNVDGLKDLAREKFGRSCKHFWDDPVFAIAANHAFSTTVEEDTGLRRIVSSTILEHMDLIEKPEIGLLMLQFNGLALGILQAGVKKQGWGKKK
jgi:hypothetical protein